MSKMTDDKACIPNKKQFLFLLVVMAILPLSIAAQGHGKLDIFLELSVLAFDNVGATF